MPDEIETMKEIAANLEKCATIMGQQIVVKKGKMVLQKDALNNIYRALCSHLIVSDIPITQFEDTLLKLDWGHQERAKRIAGQYSYLLSYSPIKWEKFDEDNKLTEIIRLKGETMKLAKDFRVCAEMAQRDATPETPAGTGQGASDDSGETPVTLREFMSNYCKNISKNILDSRVRSLQSLAQRKVITLIHTGNWTSGQSKKYLPSYLISNWQTFIGKLPSLPKLK